MVRQLVITLIIIDTHRGVVWVRGGYIHVCEDVRTSPTNLLSFSHEHKVTCMVTRKRRLSQKKKNEAWEEATYDPLGTVWKACHCGGAKRTRGVHTSTRVGHREPTVAVRVAKIGKVEAIRKAAIAHTNINASVEYVGERAWNIELWHQQACSCARVPDRTRETSQR